MATATRRTKYELRDATGEHVATHVRVDGPATVGKREIAEGDKAVYWVTPEGKAGLEAVGLPLADLPLYGIDKIGKSPIVVITEGEKAADALNAHGDVVAVGTVTGASSTPSKRALADLTGHNIILWPDNDKVGRDHMIRVAKALDGIAPVRWATWDDAPAHGDAHDFLWNPDGSPTGRDPWEVLSSASDVPTNEAKFSRRGLGYAAYFPDGDVTITYDRVKVRSGDVHGELAVRSGHPAAPRDGHLLQSSFNASGSRSRADMAKQLGNRAPGIKVDWVDHLERFCRYILAGEREGAPIVVAGGKPPATAGVRYAMYPLLPLNRPTIVFGPGGSMKSYVAAAALVTFATGESVVKGWRVDAPGQVLVIDWEADQEEWDDRVARIAAGIGIEPPRYHYMAGVRSLVDEAEKIARYRAEHDIALVIVDSVGMASPTAREGGDANETAIRLFQALKFIGGTALLVDHVTKDGAERTNAHRPYGSIFKENLARQTWELRKGGDDEDESDVVEVAVFDRKRNARGRLRPFGLDIRFGDGTVTFERTEDVPEGMTQSVPLALRIRDVLRSGPMARRDIQAALPDVLVGSLGKTLHTMLGRGDVTKLADDTYALVAHFPGEEHIA